MPPSTDTHYGDWVIGSEADDVIPTGSGRDMIYGGPGDDKIYGGPDGDGAYYTGKRANYDVVTENGVTTVTDKKGNEGSDLLIGVEYLIFSDTTEKIPDTM
jgi:Ca2+-binding RTX toxin-like protein